MRKTMRKAAVSMKAKERILALLLSTAMLLSVMPPVSAMAESTAAPAALTFTDSYDIPTSTVGTTISINVSPWVSGGTPPYSFAATGGTLPASLNMNNGKIEGTLKLSDAGSFTITATDSASPTAATASITIAYGAVTTDPTVPDMLRNFAAVPGGTGEISLSWTALADIGSATITKYEVSSDGGISWNNANTIASHTVTGLTNGTAYTFQVRAVNSVGAGAEATLTATPSEPVYGVSLDVSGTHLFPQAMAGYGAQTPLAVAVTNEGNRATGPLAVELSGMDSGSFTLSTAAIADIAIGGSAIFTVAPNTGLAPGTYSDTVMVSGANSIPATFQISFTVTAPPPGHTHTFGTNWKFDETNHWHACTADDGAISNEAAHIASEWIIDQAATEAEAGSRHKECTVCAYVMQTEAIPATGGGQDPDPGPSYSHRTLTDPDTGVKVSGSFTSGAKLEVKDRLLHQAGDCDVCDDIRERQEKGELIVLFDIGLKSGSYTGDLDVEIPVEAKYNGQEVLIIHCKDKVLESRTVTVSGGVAKSTFSSLSPFAVALQPSGTSAITGLPDDYTLLVGQSVSWTPAPVGGSWSYDKDLLSMTQGGDTYTFKGLKAGQATATYTVGGVPFTVTITINSATIPPAGHTANPLPWLLGMLAALAGCAALLLWRKRGCTRQRKG